MAPSEARAWWADVQYLRDDYERTDEARRRADAADLASRRASRDRGLVEAEVSLMATSPRGHDMPPAAEPHRGPRGMGTAAPDRRTIEIRGRTVPAPPVPRTVDLDRRRPQRRAIERVGARPDRVAMWALLMGLLLILVAIGTAGTPAVIALTLR
jgi:hypothetical protein